MLGLSRSSLISTTHFCDAVCKVSFDRKECKVYYYKKIGHDRQEHTDTDVGYFFVNPIGLLKDTTLKHLNLEATHSKY